MPYLPSFNTSVYPDYLYQQLSYNSNAAQVATNFGALIAQVPVNYSIVQPQFQGQFNQYQQPYQAQYSKVQDITQAPQVAQPVRSQLPNVQPYSQVVSTSLSPATFVERITNLLPSPPLSKLVNRPNLQYTQQKKSKRKSKFTKQQDDLIILLKHEGHNWLSIAEKAGLSSYLAARNRYQVIIGQQGNNNSLCWNKELNILLKKKLDKYENEKWLFITKEMNKIFNKNFDHHELQSAVQEMFNQNPYSFNLTDDVLVELLKEKKITEKAFEVAKDSDFDDFLSYPIDNEYNDLMY